MTSLQPTPEFLEFTLNSEGTGYLVREKDYIDESSPCVIVIPEEYNGIPVVGFDFSEGAVFKDDSIEAIYIPKTLILNESDFFELINGSATILSVIVCINGVLKTIVVDPENPCLTSRDFSGNECNCIMYTTEPFNYDMCICLTGCDTTIIPDNCFAIAPFCFKSCSFSSISIPSSVQAIFYGAFFGCSNLETVYFNGPLMSDSFELQPWFYECPNISQVILKNVESVEEFGSDHIIGSDENIIYVTLYEGDATLDKLRFALSQDGTHYIVYGKDEDITGKVIIPTIYDGLPVKVIGYKAFYAAWIDSVIMPDSIIEIESNAFQICKLHAIALPKNLQKIGDYAFHESRLENIVIPEYVDHIGKYAFSAGDLSSAIIEGYPSFIGDCAFQYSPILQTITVYEQNGWNNSDTICRMPINIIFPQKWLDKLEISDNGEYCSVECSNRTISGKVVIPETHNGLPVKRIKGYGFSECGKITEFITGDSVEEIGVEAFYDSKNLKILKIGKNVNSINSPDITIAQSGISQMVVDPENITFEINNGCFINKLEKLLIKVLPEFSGIIPNNIEIIGESSFSGESRYLTELIIPKNVKTIHPNAIVSTYELEKLILNEGIEKIGSQNFSSNKIKHLIIPESIKHIDTILTGNYEYISSVICKCSPNAFRAYGQVNQKSWLGLSNRANATIHIFDKHGWPQDVLDACPINYNLIRTDSVMIGQNKVIVSKIKNRK